MANVLKIGYLYRDPGKIGSLVSTISNTDVSVDWNAKESRIDITWEWGQEEEVQMLISLIRERFKETTVEMINEEYVSAESEEDLVDTNLPEPEEETLQIEEEPLKVETEEVELPQDDSLVYQEIYEAINEAKAQETEILQKVKETVIPNEIDTTIEVEDSSPNEEIEEDSYSDEEFEVALKELFDISKYDFKINDTKAANEFCNDYGIKSDLLKIAITLARSAPGKKELIGAISKLTRMNKAQVGVQLRSFFKRYMSEKQTAFVQKYHELDVFDFLNIFREGKRKF